MTPQTNRRMFSNGVLSHRTRTRKVRLLALLASTALAHATVAPAQSLPSGGQVTAGSATIGTPSAGALTINQTSGSAVVNWQSFNVGKANRVTFVQPDANAAILNRVTGETSSTISGQINANGQVYLINPNGIAITSSGTVKAGAFVASTLGISDDDFMGGKRSFTGNGASAPVTNAGAITINRGGYMALIGGTVANAGVITVPMGKAALGSGEQATLDLSGDGFLQVAVPTKAGGSGTLVDNSGKISARGGTVQLTAAAAKDMARQAINMSGTIEANGVSGKSGDITLTGGDGEVAVSGTLDAGNAAGKGGKVTVTGRSIKLASAKINASGKTGGGTVNIGGNRQGKGPLQHAETLDVDAHTVINADAVTTGNGGDVVLWSDDLTNFAGTITAKGGAISGNGGEAEVSGKAKLSYTGLTDLTAAHGSIGNLLLDPYNVTISTGAGSNTDGGFNATGNDSVINVNTLTNALATANVTVTTGSSSDATNPQAGTITVAAPIAWTSGSTLTLNAASDININAAINATTGGLTLTSGGTISAPAAVSIGGIFNLTSGNWVQNAVALPSFYAKDFQLTDGSFLRVTGGDGTSATPYQLADIYGVQGVRTSNAYLAANWQLINDIDASGTSNWYGGAGWKPIGVYLGTPFSGRFDGNGHIIDSLSINRPSEAKIGLFAITNGFIANLGMTNGNIVANQNVGAIAGVNLGTISHSFNTGRVSGVLGGGIAGVSVDAPSYAQAQLYPSLITDSYNTGSIIGGTIDGGLVGTIWNSSVKNSYSSGSVSNGRNIGGLIGWDQGRGSSVINSFWDIAKSGRSSSDGGVGLTSAQMENPFTFIDAGWDFSSVWGALKTGGAPVLRSLTRAPVYDYYIRLTGSSSRIYGDTIGTSGITLDGLGAQNVSVAWGSAINSSTNAGVYGYSNAGVLQLNYSAGSSGDYYVNYGTGTLTIDKRILNLSGHRTYDGTLNLDAPIFTLSNLANSETLTLSGVGTMADKDVGSSKQVTLNTLALGDGTGLANNYTLVGGSATVDISARSIAAITSITGITAGNKIYDGTTAATLNTTGAIFNGMVAGDTLTVASAFGNFADASAANGKTVNITGLTLGGADAGNYSLANGNATTVADILPRIVSLAGSRTYNGSADLDASIFTLLNLVGGETLTLSGTGSMADKNVGSGRAVSLASLLLGDGTNGGLASNYTLAGGSDTVDIAKAVISSIGGITAGNKTYDGTAGATLNTSGVVFNGKINGDTLMLGNGVSGLFSDANAGFGKTVTISGLLLSGADAGNYTLASNTATTLADIGQRIVNLSGSRTYNGSSDLDASIFTLSNLVGGETLTLSGTGSMADKNASLGKAVSLGSLTLGDDSGLASNYTLVSGTDRVDIDRASLSVGGITALNKIYDGTTIAALDTSGATFNGRIGNDVLTFSETGNFGDANVGTGKYLGFSNVRLGGADAGNYWLISSNAIQADITPRVINLSGSRTYNGGSDLAAAIFTLSNLASGETLTLSGMGSMADKNAGSGKAVTLGSLTLSDGSGLASNYMLVGGTDTVDIARATISSIGGITANGKTYDGSMAATLNTGGVTFNGLLSGDSLTLGTGFSGAFANANAGSGKTVTISNLSLSGADAGNYMLANITATTFANIDQRVVNLSGSRTYNGSSDLDASIFSLGNLVIGENLTLSGTGAVADKNAGSGKTVSLGSLSLGNGTGGGMASNYTLAGGIDTVNIAKAVISSITGITTGNKTYDGTTNAALNTSGAGFIGMIAGDALTVATSSGAFSDKNAGSAKTVNISDLTLGGADNGNYTLASDTATTTADIAKAYVFFGGISANTKTYDGTTAATVNISTIPFSGDDMHVGYTSANFSDKNAGMSKTVSINDLYITGADANNYQLGITSTTSYGTITPAIITSIGGITAGNKTYDGTTDAPLDTSGAVFNSLIQGDNLTVATALGAFSDQNVGTGKRVNISGLTLGGADAQNYRLDTNTATTLADIGQRIVNLSGSRTYNGSTDLDASIFTLSNLVGGETLTLSGIGTMADKNAGSGKGVTLASLALGDGTNGGLASNYTLAGGMDTVDIARAMISSIGGITANGKIYDGTTDATLNTAGAVFNGMVSGDTLSLGNGFSGAFSDKNAGTGKTVTISGLSLAGADAGNYTLASNTATTLADIAKRAITVTADGAHRTYGDANPGLTYTVGGSGLVAGDTLSGALVTSATTASGIGNYGITLGTLANSNYDISFTGANLAISPRALTVTADAKSKTYGDTNPALTYTANGLVNGDTLSGSLATAAGQYSGVGSYAISQGTLDNSNYSISYTGANLTITPRALTVTADAKSKIYGDANPALTYATSGLVNSDTLSGSLSTAAGQYSNVGGYGITLGSLGNANYAITYDTADLTVTPRAMTVTADAKSKTYGDANPALTYTTSGLVNNDTLSGSLVTSAGQYSGVGGYGITLGSLGNANYAITYNAANLTVTPRAMTVTVDAKSKTYGDANPALTYTTSGLVNNDTLSGSLVTSAGQYSGVGAYAIAQGTLANANYAISYTGANLTVTPRALTVTADALSKVYGDANPMLTYTATGLVNGDTLSGSLATTAGQYANVGSYAITGSFSASSNYALTYVGADLSVNRRAITVTADTLSKTYGDANPALTYTVGGAGLVNGDILSGSLSTAAGQYSNVGSYAITGSFSASNNYALTYVGGSLSVNQRALTVTADAKSKTYGDADPTLTYAATGLLNGDMLSGSLSTTAGQYSGVGAYAITQGSLANANYAISYMGADLTVNQRAITVTADSLSRRFGFANPALTYTVAGAGLVNGDRLSGGLATPATSLSEPGAYAITQGTLLASANYRMNFVPGVLTVEKAANPEPGTQASVVTPPFDTDRFASIRPVSDSAEAADGSHDVITDPRFEGTFVCLDNGNGCISLPGQATP